MSLKLGEYVQGCKHAGSANVGYIKKHENTEKNTLSWRGGGVVAQLGDLYHLWRCTNITASPPFLFLDQMEIN